MNERIATMGRLAEIADAEAASPDCEPWERDWLKQRAQMYRDEQAAQIARLETDSRCHGIDAASDRAAQMPYTAAKHAPTSGTVLVIFFTIEVLGAIALWVWCKKEGRL